MLKLQTEPTFMAKVVIPSPWGDQTIKMVFKYMDTDEYDAFMKKETETKRSDEEIIIDIATDWKEVDGEFNKENIALLCKRYHRASVQIVNAWIENVKQARLEN